MNPIRFTINEVNRTVYLKGVDAEPSGPGVVGQATLYLDQQAGGLDIRFGDVVKVWLTNTIAGGGVYPNGRLFGGIVASRETTVVGTTKVWRLRCFSFNVLLSKLARRAQSGSTIDLPVGETFGQHVRRVLDAVQRNGATNWPTYQIDGTTQVVDLVASMPAQTLPPGKTLGWYLAALAKTARTVTPALWPAFYIDVGRSFGNTAQFGGPVLHYYDAALAPAVTGHFTDTPGTPAGANTIFGEFRRTTDGADVVQFRESYWHYPDQLISSYSDGASQALYPNRFTNHGLAGNTGYWTDEVLEDKDSTSWAQADATVRAAVQAKAAPRDSIEFDTDYMALPGDVVGITWALEGLVDSPMRVASVSWDITDKTAIWSRLTVGQRILELGEDGEAVLVLPHEGNVAPTPPGALSITTNVVDEDPRLRRAHVVVQGAESTSPAALFYRLYDAITRAVLVDNIAPSGGQAIADFHYPAATGLTVNMVAVGGGGLESAPTANLPIITASPTITAPTNFRMDPLGNSGHGFGWTVTGAWLDTLWDYTAPAYGDPDSWDLEYWGDAHASTNLTLPHDWRGGRLESLAVPDTWHFRVRARVLEFVSAWSTFQVTIPVEDVSEPSNLTVTANVYDPKAGRTRVDLDWDASVPTAWQNTIVAYDLTYTGNGKGVETARVSDTAYRLWVTAGVTLVMWLNAVSSTGARSDDVPVPHLSVVASGLPPGDSGPRNPGFELEDPDATTMPAHWTATGTVSRAAIDGWTGDMSPPSKYGLRLENTGAEATSAPFWVRAGTGYAFGAVVLGPDNSPGASVVLEAWVDWYSPGGSLLSSSRLTPAPPYYAYANTAGAPVGTATAPSNTASARLRIKWVSGSNEFYVDNIRWDAQVPPDGLGDSTIASSKLQDVVTGGTYRSVTVNTKGQVTAGDNSQVTGLVEARYRAQATTAYTANPEPTTDTDVTGLSVSFSLAASRTVVLTVWARVQKATGATRVHLTDGSNNMLFPINTANAQAVVSIPTSVSGSGSNSDEQYLVIRGQVTLAAGSWTIKARHQAAGTTAAVTYNDRFIEAEVIAP